MPRYVIAKTLADGRTAYYWTCPAIYRKMGCPWKSGALGSGLSQADLDAAAHVWNTRFDEWKGQGSPERDRGRNHHAFGTIAWLFDYYLDHDAFRENVAEANRADYRRILNRVAAMPTEGGQKTYGEVKVREFGVKAAVRVYKTMFDDGAQRSAEKAVTYCETAWARMRPHFPEIFRKDVENPWSGVTIRRREKRKKGHCTRAEVYAFAWKAIETGNDHLAAAPVLAFEFFLRPSNIAAGFAAWSGYRGADAPDRFVVRHRKNGGMVRHYLDDPENIDPVTDAPALFYPEAEAVFAKIRRRGASMVTLQDGRIFKDGTRLPNEIRKLAAEFGMNGFTIEKCRHGGMTELEEKGLTEGQGKALSTHRSRAYGVYAKETDARVLSATKARFPHSESLKNPLKTRAEN